MELPGPIWSLELKVQKAATMETKTKPTPVSTPAKWRNAVTALFIKALRHAMMGTTTTRTSALSAANNPNVGTAFFKTEKPVMTAMTMPTMHAPTPVNRRAAAMVLSIMVKKPVTMAIKTTTTDAPTNAR